MESLRSFFRTLLVVWVLLACGGPRTGLAGDPPGATRRAELATRLEGQLDALESARADLRRETFQVQALADAVGKDPDKLLAWVREQTSPIAYRGSLRGAQGVLLDRMGNSLDRALLLGELLGGAGHEVRLARATLTPDKAGAILSRRPKPGAEPELTDADLDKLVQASAGRTKADAAALRRQVRQARLGLEAQQEELAQARAEHLGILASALGKQWGQKPPDAAQAVQDACDHWWVQVRKGQQWVDLDPADAGVKARETRAWPVPDRPLPSAECHEIELRVVVERWNKGQLSQQVAMRHVLSPGQTLGKNIALIQNPRNWAAKLGGLSGARAAAEYRKAALAQDEWLPAVAVGDRLYAQKSFDDSGTLIDRPEVDPAAEVGHAAGGMMGGLGGMMGGGESKPKKEGVLTAQWVEFEIRTPGRPARIVRHEVFDLLGPARRAAGAPTFTLTPAQRLDRGLALLGRLEILPSPCRFSRDFVTDLAAGSILAQRKALLAAARGQTGAGEVTVGGPAFPLTLYSLADARFDAAVRTCISTCNLLLCRTQPVMKGDALSVRTILDVACNEVAPVEAAAEQAIRARLEQGVADTAAERMILSAGQAENTCGVFAAAAAQSIPPVVVRTQDDLKGLDLPDDARARIAQTVREGCVVVVPGKSLSLDGQRRTGWWRVEPTGWVVGVGDRGYRQSLTERQLQAKLNSLAYNQQAWNSPLSVWARYTPQQLQQLLVPNGMACTSEMNLLLFQLSESMKVLAGFGGLL